LSAPGVEARRLDTLISWPDIPELRHFSGTAAYDVNVDLDRIPPGAPVILDLGDVRDIADIDVNGQAAGVAWKKPYRLEVTNFVRPGRNGIRVRVTNLWINAFLGMPPPDYSRLRARYGILFPDPSEWKTAGPLSSGLLGPVRLEIGW
jgi:hypothetical protein